jgi:hypothetical protein
MLRTAAPRSHPSSLKEVVVTTGEEDKDMLHDM